jgi:(p)ppGpp synthase/HD superfamily hydrolase
MPQYAYRSCKAEKLLGEYDRVEKEIRRFGKPVTDAVLDEIVAGVAKRVGINTADDFYNTLGFGGISLQRFMPKIKEDYAKLGKADQPIIAAPPKKRTRSKEGVIVEAYAMEEIPR